MDKKSKLKYFISSFFSQIGLRNLTDGHFGRQPSKSNKTMFLFDRLYHLAAKHP